MGDVCRIDSSGLDATLRAFSAEARVKALFTAVTAGAKALQAETVARLKAKMGEGATRRGLQGRPRYASHSPMTEGVRLMKDRAYVEAGVHIMGDFRLKWFEKGTRLRYAGGRAGSRKQGYFRSYYRGEIKGLAFFQEARSQESRITEAVENTLGKEITKILK